MGVLAGVFVGGMGVNVSVAGTSVGVLLGLSVGTETVAEAGAGGTSAGDAEGMLQAIKMKINVRKIIQFFFMYIIRFAFPNFRQVLD